ncbi:uncharacterized protein RHIMIDRAFT_264530 [Rhizopus microsporus ATCC 52813]|uniref:Uncharacterized protein n=1 Tax=Rhizopus microsporus ATCC 52813 TaxID=1340429 RepID=A0A2G4T4H7_RHIZD|nr:uncharacterized protein RHIMIDRAFT_264530 [Rhizopus microsporus ATCC 52813]PHZ15924.1 hypothetical protein RHIMIDRAFT_264530 [Rhizopus microsporus ATCC 52813]
MKPQDKVSRSLKENTLTAINSNKSLGITSKLKNTDKKDIDAVQIFIKQNKQEFKTRPSCLSSTLAIEDQNTSLYLSCTKLMLNLLEACQTM